MSARLEVFNGVISHHLADNPHLVYAILSSHQSFEAMSTFTLHKGLQDIANARRPADEQPASRSTGKNEVGQRSLVDANSQKGKPSVDSTEDIEACLRSASSRHDTAHLASTERTASRSNSTCGDAPLSRPSDKAQGKMKARRISSSDTAIMEALASVSGRTGFVPTHEWVSLPCTHGCT